MNTKPMRRKDDGIVRKNNHKVIGLLVAVIITFCLITLSRSESFTASSDVEISTTTETTVTTTTYETTSTTTTSVSTSTTAVDTTSSTCSSVTGTTMSSVVKTEQYVPIKTTAFIVVAPRATETTPVKEETTVPVAEPVTNVEETTTEPKPVVIVYKPSTHYIHKSNCRWADSTCHEITDTNGIEARKCSECAPDIEIVNAYVPPAPQGSLAYISDAERVMLCNVVAGEYGSDWVSLYDKACVVAVVMNRYYDGGWQGAGRANTISNVLTAPGQFVGYYAANGYNSLVTQSCIDAVEYYFNHQSDFPHYLSFYGDGTRNYFS